MQRSLTSVVLAATAVVFSSQDVSAGPVSVSVEGIPDAFMQWDVPLLNPGDTWTREFEFEGPDGSARAWGTIEAACWASGGFLNITEGGLRSDGHARTLNLEFTAQIDYGFSAGWKNARQGFWATQDLHSSIARIDWTKGASWNNVVLPQLAGFFDPHDLLNSSLHDGNARWGILAPPVRLTSRTTIRLMAGAGFDAVYLPRSAFDIVPAPSSLWVVLGVGVVAGWRRRR